MALVALYNVKNVQTTARIAIDRVILDPGQRCGIIYRSPAVNAAYKAGYITLDITTATFPTVMNEYINSLKGLAPTVEPYPVGATGGAAPY